MLYKSKRANKKVLKTQKYTQSTMIMFKSQVTYLCYQTTNAYIALKDQTFASPRHFIFALCNFFSDRKGAVEIKPHNTVCQRSNNAVALLIEICTVSVWLFAGTGRFRSFTPIKSNQNLKTPHKTSVTNYTICVSYWYGILRWNIVLQHLNQGWNEHT